jgi:ABC-type multidrug transport system fused ATPase/permease subunit
MLKSIAKEVGIVILLITTIILVIGIVFYDYIPKNKSIPIKRQAYEFSEDIKSELQENVEEGENVIITYYLDETDLDAYESKNDYDKGNPNPFSLTSTESSTEVTNNNINSNNKVSNTENKEVYYNKSGKF